MEVDQARGKDAPLRACGLLLLPDELLLVIAKSARCYTSLAMLCRRWHRIVEPMVWSAIEFNEGGDHPEADTLVRGVISLTARCGRLHEIRSLACSVSDHYNPVARKLLAFPFTLSRLQYSTISASETILPLHVTDAFKRIETLEEIAIMGVVTECEDGEFTLAQVPSLRSFVVDHIDVELWRKTPPLFRSFTIGVETYNKHFSDALFPLSILQSLEAFSITSFGGPQSNTSLPGFVFDNEMGHWLLQDSGRLPQKLTSVSLDDLNLFSAPTARRADGVQKLLMALAPVLPFRDLRLSRFGSLGGENWPSWEGINVPSVKSLQVTLAPGVLPHEVSATALRRLADLVGCFPSLKYLCLENWLTNESNLEDILSSSKPKLALVHPVLFALISHLETTSTLVFRVDDLRWYREDVNQPFLRERVHRIL